MTPFMWAALAGMSAVGLEFVYRQGAPWLPNLYWILPVSLLINFAMYQLLRSDLGWMYSIVLFGATTAALRIILSWVVLHETITLGGAIAAAALLTGALARLVWR